MLLLYHWLSWLVMADGLGKNASSVQAVEKIQQSPRITIKINPLQARNFVEDCIFLGVFEAGSRTGDGQANLIPHPLYRGYSNRCERTCQGEDHYSSDSEKFS
jgi:hypothetical protein